MIPVEDTIATEQPSQQLAEVAEEGLSVTVDASPVEFPKEIPGSTENEEEKVEPFEAIENTTVDSDPTVEEQVLVGHSTREVWRPSHYINVTKISRKQWHLETVQYAIRKKLKHLFKELKALGPVCHASLKGRTKLFKLHMFVVEK